MQLMQKENSSVNRNSLKKLGDHLWWNNDDSFFVDTCVETARGQGIEGQFVKCGYIMEIAGKECVLKRRLRYHLQSIDKNPSFHWNSDIWLLRKKRSKLITNTSSCKTVQQSCFKEWDYCYIRNNNYEQGLVNSRIFG